MQNNKGSMCVQKALPGEASGTWTHRLRLTDRDWALRGGVKQKSKCSLFSPYPQSSEGQGLIPVT